MAKQNKAKISLPNLINLDNIGTNSLAYNYIISRVEKAVLEPNVVQEIDKRLHQSGLVYRRIYPSSINANIKSFPLVLNKKVCGALFTFHPESPHTVDSIQALLKTLDTDLKNISSHQKSLDTDRPSG